ncbi:MAG: hypothetical protein GQ527_10650 [Bacteroidales bacterium]|nr:hypothetical protein [Bacteroidales bacterium]
MNRIIYIHIPRTAGNAVITALEANDNIDLVRHDLRDPEYKFYKQQPLSGDQVLSFVRDPFSRAYSAYNFLKNGGLHEPDAFDSYLLGLNHLSFEEFILERLEDASKWQIHFIPQSRWILGAEDPKIYKFENISSEFDRMCLENELESNTLQQINKASYDFPDHLNIRKKAKRIIKKVYKDDFKMFGY